MLTSIVEHFFQLAWFNHQLESTTVDGRTPAPPGMYKTWVNNGINMDKLPMLETLIKNQPAYVEM